MSTTEKKPIKLTRAEKQSIASAVQRANNKPKGIKSAQDSIPYRHIFPDGILLKILLFPITLVLSVIVLVCEFLCVFSTMLLSVLALLLFVLALAIMVLIGEVGEGLKALLAAYLISPYGVPMLAAWLIGAVGGINERLKAI